MKSIIASTAALLSIASTAAADFVVTQSEPFTLELQSANDTLNGKALFACHEGAGIECLCIGTGPGEPFQLNTTHQVVTNQTLGETGVLTYLLHGNNFNASSGMTLEYHPYTNVAHAVFQPGVTNTQVGFDTSHRLFIPALDDDTISPPIRGGTERGLYHWYICSYAFLAYNYQSLNFAVGLAEPQNPSCQKVEVVKRGVKGGEPA